MPDNKFNRIQILFGQTKMLALSQKKIIIFGIGGVGSWCAESLVRSGITNLTLVDPDKVCETNINRQVHATVETIGQNKTQALKTRLLQINPAANITNLQITYSKDTFNQFNLSNYDYIIDAIDSLSNKIHLIQTATKTNATFFSSMGAALKVDPTRIKTGPFWEVRGCPLARHLRKRLRKYNTTESNFLCVYSDELLDNIGAIQNHQTQQLSPDLSQFDNTKAVINGSIAHITAIFGFTIAGLVIKHIYDNN